MVCIVNYSLVIYFINNSKNNLSQASAHKLTDQDRYNSGFSKDNADCIKGDDIIDKYQQTFDYMCHSDLYKLGYQDAVTNCIYTIDTNIINKNDNIGNDVPVGSSNKNSNMNAI